MPLTSPSACLNAAPSAIAVSCVGPVMIRVSIHAGGGLTYQLCGGRLYEDRLLLS